MDQVSYRSGVASNDTTDEATSLADDRWSDEDEVKSLLNYKILIFSAQTTH